MTKRSARSRAKAPEEPQPTPEKEALVYGVWLESGQGFHACVVHLPQSVVEAAVKDDPAAVYWPATTQSMAIAQVVKDLEERMARRGL